MSFGRFFTGVVITILLLLGAPYLSTIVPIATVAALALYGAYFVGCLRLPAVLTDRVMDDAPLDELENIVKAEKLGLPGYGLVLCREVFGVAFIAAAMGAVIWGGGSLLIHLGVITVTYTG
ncbi:MAG: hypothetical protein GC134_09090 [Proteobacteria bacterium]|nr:hypothetical protein [Pseudomonadota bacterium]